VADGDDELGPCTKCDHGWITVGERYVETELALPDPSKEIVPDHEAWLAQRRTALAATIYPCRQCRPAAFMRWAKGYPSVPEEATTVVRRRRRK
jgi:hypothetical protein